ncbi:hypothetical protein HY229_00750 [Candidatus Acetothermia bacterium]|nr:hypothetical protein [Candidatus Acetothermia bacterium]MBI3642619.1 hypothetical protein [Candidatus Acetothermia bacterium]
MKSESLPGQGIRVQSWSIPINTDFGSNFKVSVVGTITIDPTITLSIHTTCSHWTEITAFGVHIGWLCDSHGIEVTSSLELNEQANLTITGTASYSLPQSVQEVDIATYNFNPITFSIGPVPVVLTPQIVIYIGADGSVSASLSVNATQTLDLVSGFHYLTGTGFNDLGQTSSTFSIQNPMYQLQLDIRAYAGVKFEIFLYGLIGPYGALEAGPEFKASITGVVAASPQAGALLWELNGCINLKAGIDSIDILGIQYDKDLYEGCTTFASRENEPPLVSITAPTPGSNKTNLHQNLIGAVSDPEGGPVTCSWTSSVAADQLSSASCNDSFTFPAYGSRTLTLTGTDQAGASTSATVSIGIQNLSGPVGPKIEICCALKETGYFDVDQPLTLLDPDDLVASKNKINWTFACCDPVPPKTASTGIKIDQALGTENPIKWTPGSLKEFNGLCGVIGKGTITLTVTDPKGATQKSTVDITLVRTSCGK